MADITGSQEQVEVAEDAETAPLSPTRTQPRARPVPQAVARHMAGAGSTPAEHNLDEVDPFTFKPPFTLCDKLLIAFNALWLFPIRLIFILLTVVAGTIVCFTSTMCEPYDPNNPTPRAKWRRKVANRLCVVIDRAFLFGFGYHWIHYKGCPASVEEAPLVALVPHTSMIDMFAAGLYELPTFVARDNVKDLFILGCKWTAVQYADRGASFIVRIFLLFFGFHWIHYRGRRAKTKDAPIVIMAPHSSFLDVFVASLYGAPTFVARHDMGNIRLFGPIITKALRTIYVKRDDPDSKMKAAEEIRRRAFSGGVWPKVLIFPEGTTTNRRMIISFKKGAFLPKLPVQPFLIKYNNRLATATWGKTGWNQIIGLFYTICQFHNSLELEFLDVYRPSEAEKADVDLYTRNVQALISEHLGIPTGIQSLEDNFFMMQAEKLGLPFPSGMVLYNRISKEGGVGFTLVRSFLNRFAAIDGDKDGWITPKDMATFLSVPNDACLQALFWTTEKACGEKLSFKQYLYGFVVRAKPYLNDQTFLKSVFNFFDKDGDGFVGMSDISQVLPVTRLPEVKSIQVRRRRRSRLDGHRGDGTANHVGIGLEAEEATKMDFDQFKLMLEVNPEYLLLFHECQNAGFSSPLSPHVTTSSDNSTSHNSPAITASSASNSQEQPRVVIEVVEAEC